MTEPQTATRPAPIACPEGGLRLGPVLLTWGPDRPLGLLPAAQEPDGAAPSRESVALVELFTSDELRERTSQAYYRSAVGARLRVGSAERVDIAGAERAVVEQLDPVTGLRTRTTLTAPRGAHAVRVETTILNNGPRPIALTAVGSATVRFSDDEASTRAARLLTADSEWLAEDRWHEQPLAELLPELDLPLHGQDGRGHAALTSHGAWSCGEHLPVGAVLTEDLAWGWQLETSAGWHVDLCQTARGGVLTVLGPTDLEHQWAHRLEPGASFDAVPAVLALSDGGVDGLAAELTAYRRWLRGTEPSQVGGPGAALPVVYNDFMNTLMGQPTTEALEPLIHAAAEAGAEVFCIDAGWFASPAIGDWWNTVGQWREAADRFPDGGLRRVTDLIASLGMRVGLWLEPEVVGVTSPLADAYPPEAYFQRLGGRVNENSRYHLDFRHPAVRRALTETVDHVVETYGAGYLKLDYNINPGAGTEVDATTSGDGLLGHTRAFRQWLLDIQERHPGLLIENCSSGGMRADYSLLSATHIQSTSDQQDLLLYPPVAASAPMSILPEQCGNWAYPAASMSRELTALTLVTGLSGRLYLSGFLGELDDEQRSLVHEAVALHKELRGELSAAVPFWPLGLPGWSDRVVCLGLHLPGHDLLFVWDRDGGEPVLVPGITGKATQLFPAPLERDWGIAVGPEGLGLTTLPGASARVLTVTTALASEGARA